MSSADSVPSVPIADDVHLTSLSGRSTSLAVDVLDSHEPDVSDPSGGAPARPGEPVVRSCVCGTRAEGRSVQPRVGPLAFSLPKRVRR